MSKYTNASGVPMSIAVFLATDNYDHDPETISATALLKPIRQSILASRLPEGIGAPDLTQMMPSRMGSAIHDGIERSWLTNYKQALADLGLPKRVVELVKVNPTKEELTDETIPVYLEQRAYKKVGDYTISGKFDFVGEGRVEDFKSTSVFSAMSGSNDKKYAQQGSIYRWLSPDLITQDQMAIQFIFTDWSAMQARSQKDYPPARFHQRILPLMSIAETDQFVRTKLALLEQYEDALEPDLPLCGDEDLWRSEPVFKYYGDANKTAGRSSKNFDNKQEAMIHMSQKGKGVVLEKPGQVQACKYCSAFPLCSQKDTLIAEGSLIL